MNDKEIALDNLPSEKEVYDLLFDTLYLNVRELSEKQVNNKWKEINKLIDSIIVEKYELCDDARIDVIGYEYCILLFNRNDVWWRDCYEIIQIPNLLKSDKLQHNTKKALLDVLNGIITILNE